MPLAISQVDASEQWVVLRGWLAVLVLVQEDWGASHFDTQLLDSLLAVDGEEEGLQTGLGFHQSHDGEVLREAT